MNFAVIAAQLAVRKALKLCYSGLANGQSVVHAIQNHTRLQSAYIEHAVDDQIQYLLDRLEPYEQNKGLLADMCQHYETLSERHAEAVMDFRRAIAKSEG